MVVRGESLSLSFVVEGICWDVRFCGRIMVGAGQNAEAGATLRERRDGREYSFMSKEATYNLGLPGAVEEALDGAVEGALSRGAASLADTAPLGVPIPIPRSLAMAAAGAGARTVRCVGIACGDGDGGVMPMKGVLADSCWRAAVSLRTVAMTPGREKKSGRRGPSERRS